MRLRVHSGVIYGINSLLENGSHKNILNTNVILCLLNIIIN